MTGEEMERAIEFLLQSQAAHDTRLDQLAAQVSEIGRQLTETSRQLQSYAETQSEFIEIVTRTMTGLGEAQAHTDRVAAATDARLDRLAGLFEQHLNDVEGKR